MSDPTPDPEGETPVSVQKPDLYVVFDGPPGPESGRFIEVEDAWGNGVDASPSSWEHRDDGYWVLGPFHAVTPTDGLTEDGAAFMAEQQPDA